jgi:hypothetical protein
MKRIAIINVGTNASHGDLRSPIFPDGSFEYVPIPEPRHMSGPSLICYRELRPHGGVALRDVIPPRYWNLPCHHDPEWDTLTYGDYTRYGRGGNLRRLQRGDLLFFLVRLVPWEDGRFARDAGFHLVGFFEVEEVVHDVRGPLQPGAMERFAGNAHVRRALADRRYWDGFWLCRGSPRSRRFRRAVPFRRAQAQEVMRRADGGEWQWPAHRSELQTIGSYTRTCVVIEGEFGAGRIGRLLAHIHASGEDMSPWLGEKALREARAWSPLGRPWREDSTTPS